MTMFKRVLAAILLGLLLPALAVAGPAAKPKPAATGPVLVVGDSLSAAHNIPVAAGWVNLLDLRLKRDMKAPPAVVNASISGETSAGALTRLPALLAKHRPSVVVIELGGNDALRGLPLAQLRGNLARMIELSQAAGAKVLLVGIDVPPNYGPAYTRRFADTFAEVARAQRVAFVPFLMEGFADRPELYQPDGIHPAAQAQPLILDTVWRGLRPLLAPPPRR